MSNKPSCLLFLSWQSDRPDCRNFVSSILKKLERSLSNLVTINIDRDTVNVPGSPDIGDTIFEKIDQCDLFIADITLINDRTSSYRRTPNPNVLIELGYAIKTLGWERILLLQCKDYGDIEELPFDINHRRIVNFSLGLETCNKNKSESKEYVIKCISESINLLLSKNLLWGGKKRKTPKFEITWLGNSGIMSNLRLKIKNVSSILISELKCHTLLIVWNEKNNKEIDFKPHYKSTSLSSGESTELELNNQILGAGPHCSNYAWSNFDLKLQFSCEDEEGTEYWYEVNKHIDDANSSDFSGIWPVKYIG